jgi:photosystem II stability/assembly factor-like uncharacterized protein
MKTTFKRTTAVGSLAIAVGLLTTCGQQQSSTTPASISGPHQSVVLAADVIYQTANSGHTWSQLHLPGHPATGHSIEVRGNTVAVVTVDAKGMAYQRSADGGTTWQKTAVPLAAPTDHASVALSPDGTRVAVLAAMPGGAGMVGVPELFVGATAGSLTARQAPTTGDVAFTTGHRLVLIGGPLRDSLYSSDDEGVTWAQHPVDGTLAPAFNVDPNTPSLGQALSDPNGSVALPVTSHTTPSVVDIEHSADGVTFTHGVKVTLAGDLGPGVEALVAAAGPGRFVVAEPASTVLHIVDGSGQRRISTTGLTGPVDALTFIDATNGLARVTLRAACSTKQACPADTVTMFSTSDGGRSWQPIAG